MTVEKAHKRITFKPWGVNDPSPWQVPDQLGRLTGEIWFERTDSMAAQPELLLKVLLTNQPLSLQVHPGDAYAREMGQVRGKSEAWYVINADKRAEVTLGLKEACSSDALRTAIEDGTIDEMVARKAIFSGDVIVVPAGTIHAIGAGVTIAEIQQRSDVTFRISDAGRGRELQIDRALAVACPGPAALQAPIRTISPARRLLVANQYFLFERIDLPPRSTWLIEAKQELWLLVCEGAVAADNIKTGTGEALFAHSQFIEIVAGPEGAFCLVAYANDGSLNPCIMERLSSRGRPGMPVPLNSQSKVPSRGLMHRAGQQGPRS